MKFTVKKFGETLRRIRKAKDLSQECLALMTGIDRSYLGGIERGERNPSLKLILLIAKTLEISPMEFFKC